MSGYRQLHTHIWSDGWFAELEPHLKLLFIYLFGNERASICGLYELSLRTISFETGLDPAVVKQALAAFDAAGRVKYDFAAGVVWVRNMPKYQGSSSPKVQARIQADIKAVPDCALKQQFLQELSQAAGTLSAPAHTLPLPSGNSSDTSIYSSAIDQSNWEGEPAIKSALNGFAPPEPSPGQPASQSSFDGPAHPERSEGQPELPLDLPDTPAQAQAHPDIRLYVAVTGGRLPGRPQYQAVIDSIRFLRARHQLDDAALQAWLAPYWIAWSTRKRLDGRPYDPGNLTWLTEWALNRSIPPSGGPKAPGPARPAIPTPAETRRMLAERDEQLKAAVPPPPGLREKMRSLKEQLAGRDAP